MQPHYIYSPREMTRWVRGIYEALKPVESLPVEGLVRIWAHEGLRLFQDRSAISICACTNFINVYLLHPLLVVLLIKLPVYLYIIKMIFEMLLLQMSFCY